MEPEVKKFLALIVQAMSMTILWLMLVTFFGIKLGLMFPEGPMGVWNYVFFAGMVISFGGLLYYLRLKWKQMPDLRAGE